MSDSGNVISLDIPCLAGISWLACDLKVVATGDWRRDRPGSLRQDADHLGAPADLAVVSAFQTHGDAVAVMDQAHPLYGHATAAQQSDKPGKTGGKGISILLPQTDAIILNTPGFLAAVATADCVPVVVADLACHRAAIIHAGWRGTYRRITQKALRRMLTLGSRPEDLRLWIGPCIRQRSYEVGEDLIAKFEREFSDIPRAIDGSRFDLAAINIWQARAMGLAENNIADCGECTFENPRLPSFRREGEAAGRMLTRIAIR